MPEQKGNCIVTTTEGWTGSHIMQEAKKCESCFKQITPCATKGSKADHKNIMYIDPENVHECANCFEKASCVVLIPPSTSNKTHIVKKYLEACKEANVELVVLISMVGAGESESECDKEIQEFRHLEQMVQDSGIKGYCIARLGFYAENFLLYKDQIKRGQLPVPIHEGKLAAISLADAGQAVLKLCENCYKEPSKHISEVVELTGCESLSAEEIAQCVSRGLGQEIKLNVISDQEAEKILSSCDIDSCEQHVILSAYHLTEKGKMAKVTDDVEKLLGHKPTSLDKFFTMHRQEICH